MSDPTLDALAQFEDESQWKIIPDVPLFDVHQEKNEKGEVVRDITPDFLQELADTCNLREEATGDVSPSGAGHLLRDPDGKPVKETDQPAIWAYYRNFHVGEFGPSKKTALLADCYVKPEHYDEYVSYPRRSVELWWKDKIIDWVGALRRTPKRDLGLIVAHKTGPIYTCEAPMTDDLAAGRTQTEGDDDPMVAKCMSAFMAHPQMKQMQTFMAESAPVIQHLAKKYAAELGAGNGAIPEPSKVEPQNDEKLKPEEHARKADDALHFAKVERENAELKKQMADTSAKVDSLVGQYQRKDREGKLITLQREGYQLDVEEEMKEFAKATDEQFAGHLARIVKHYQKDPTGPMLRIAGDNDHIPVPTRDTGLSEDKLQEALRYQREHKDCDTFEKALEGVSKTQKTPAKVTA